MAETNRSRKDLLKEIQALRVRVAELESQADDRSTTADPQQADDRLYPLSEQQTAELARANQITQAINDVFKKTLTCKTEEELGKTCLAIAEELTGSKFGFIGELNPAGLMDDIAISNPGWDACKIAVTDARRYINNMPIQGIDRSTIRDGKSRIVNRDEMAIHPERVGVPEGHPEVTAFLGVPLKHAGKTIGMIGLGNKEGGYAAADQESIESLSVAIVEALRYKRAEEELSKHREHLEEIVEERTAELQKEVTERKQAEESLSLAYSKLRAVFDAIQDAILVVDLVFHIVC